MRRLGIFFAVVGSLGLIWVSGEDQTVTTATSPDLMVEIDEPATICRPQAIVHEDASITVIDGDCNEFGIDNEYVRWSTGFSGPYRDVTYQGSA